MLNYALYSLAIITTLTGLTLPRLLVQDNIVLLPTMLADNKPETIMLPTVHLKPQPQRQDNDPGPALLAKAGYVLDYTSRATLWAKNENEALPIASITKLMTALVVADHTTDWSTPYTIQATDVAYGGSKFVPGVGDQYTQQDLLKTALVASANNAAAALARSTGLSDDDFAAAMNAKAQQLGMTHSYFVEPTGLSAHNTATAGDVALLMAAAVHDRVIYQAMTQVEHRLRRLNNPEQGTEFIVHTTDELLLHNDPYVKIGKTGFTYEAGNCLTTLASDAAGHQLITVILGAPDADSRFTETHNIIAWTFEHYKWANNN